MLAAVINQLIVVAAHKEQGRIQCADEIFQVIIGQVAAADQQANIREALHEEWAV